MVFGSIGYGIELASINYYFICISFWEDNNRINKFGTMFVVNSSMEANTFNDTVSFKIIKNFLNFFLCSEWGFWFFFVSLVQHAV